MARHMGKVYILGLMERYMMESGRMELKMAMVYGKEYLGILIQVNGKILKQMGMVYISGKMVTDMKVNGCNV